MKLLLNIIACAAILTGVFAPRLVLADEWKLTLEQSVEQALAENRDISVAKERLEEIRGIKGELRAEGLPQLTGTAEYQRTWRRPQIIINGLPFKVGSEHNYSAGAEVTQLLWDGGKVIGAVKAARTEEARGIETIRDAEEQIRFQVRYTFYQILYTDKVIDVLERQLKQLRSHLSSIQTRYNQGIDSDYALMRQEVEVSNIEPELIEAKRNRELLANVIKVLLAIPPEDKYVPAGQFDYKAKAVPPVEDLISKGREARPDLNAERLREKSLMQNVSVQKAGWWPQLSFSTGWLWQGQSNDWKVGSNERTDSLNSALTLSWPIFDGLKTRSRVNQAKAKLMQQTYATSQYEDNVVKEILNVFETLMKAREALRSQQKSYALARKATAIAGERFESGLMSQLELNDTITQQAKPEQLFLQASFDCLTSEAALEKSVGGEL